MAATYRREHDLREDVVSWLKDYCECDVVVDEVEGVQGIPDLVGTQASPQALAERLAQPLVPVCRPWELYVLWMLGPSLLESELAALLPGPPWRRWRRREIQELIRLGWLTHDSADIEGDHPQRRWRATASFEDPVGRLIAVHLKVRQGRPGLIQALQCTGYVDDTYLAMPSECITATCRTEAARAQIGLLAVRPGAVEVLLEPSRQGAWSAHTRRLIAERILLSLRHPELAPREAGTPGGPGVRAWTLCRQQYLQSLADTSGGCLT